MLTKLYLYGRDILLTNSTLLVLLLVLRLLIYIIEISSIESKATTIHALTNSYFPIHRSWPGRH